MNRNDPGYAAAVAQAQAYRQQLGTQGIHFGKADGLVKQKFPGVDINDVRERKVGGFAKVGGAVGDVVGKYVGPAVSLLNPAVGAALTGVGRVLGKANDPGGLKGMKFFKDVAAPTAMAYGLGKVGQGVGKMLSGGAPGMVAGAAPGATAPAMAMTPSVVGSSIPTMGTIGKIATGGAGSFVSGVGKVLTNPAFLKGAEIATNAYGAQQMGKAEDRQADLEEQGMTREWDWQDQERERQRRVVQEILANRAAARGGMVA